MVTSQGAALFLSSPATQFSETVSEVTMNLLEDLAFRGQLYQVTDQDAGGYEQRQIGEPAADSR